MVLDRSSSIIFYKWISRSPTIIGWKDYSFHCGQGIFTLYEFIEGCFITYYGEFSMSAWKDYVLGHCIWSNKIKIRSFIFLNKEGTEVRIIIGLNSRGMLWEEEKGFWIFERLSSKISMNLGCIMIFDDSICVCWASYYGVINGDDSYSSK